MDAFYLPVDADGTLEFAKGEKIDVACSGSTVHIKNKDTKKEVVVAECLAGTVFTISNDNVEFKSINCTKGVENNARYTGKDCVGTTYKEIEIGMIVQNRFIRHIISCFDTVLQHVPYTVHTLTKTIAGYQSGYPRPSSFKGAMFYSFDSGSISYYYSRTGQRTTINKILNLPPNDTSIIQEDTIYYLSVGHYAARTDFIYGSQQRLTFYYVNGAPQWQTFNAGNWNTMEKNCRSLADERKLDLIIYTGAIGATTLPDDKNVQRELYLYKPSKSKKGLPVPRLFFRVVYEPIAKSGVALIGVNNPYKNVTKNDKICTDVCNKVKWISWIKDDIDLGYSYCCTVNDFRNRVKYLPPFEVKSLLV